MGIGVYTALMAFTNPFLSPSQYRVRSAPAFPPCLLDFLSVVTSISWEFRSKRRVHLVAYSLGY